MRRISRALAALLLAVFCLSCAMPLSACGKSETAMSGYEKNEKLDTSAPVTLTIVSSRETWPEMDNVIIKFEEQYPNCNINCEYIESYTDNLPTRLSQNEHKVDIFRTANILHGSELEKFTLNLISEESKAILDLSGTNSGLVDNFRCTTVENTQYVIPYGGELRGMYVNTTLLDKYGLAVPTNRSELLHCCEVLYDAGYIPFQSSPGTFAQQLLYPYICNSIVNGGNYEKMYADIENCVPGVSEYFRDPYAFLYEIVEKGYFDYKRVETELGYTFPGSEGKAREFLNVLQVGEDKFEKQDDVGKIAFLIDTQAFEIELAKVKSDYHSQIEYQFILSPVGEDGGYAYLSPSDGLAINKNSDNVDWALEFFNFFFTPEITTAFAAESGKIPNTADALLQFDVPAQRSCDVGQVTFSGYNFYKVVTPLLLSGYEDDMIGIGKMNNPKYMTKNDDGSYSLTYTLDDYMTRLEAEFQKIKEAA